jgi:ketosteroid isomerase-like protein
MTPEAELIKRYFDAFNRHDIEGVMGATMTNLSWLLPTVRDAKAALQYANRMKPSLRCSRTLTANCAPALATPVRVSPSHSLAERGQAKGRVEAIGAEVMEIVDGKIKEIRDYHHTLPAKTA